ncbi:virulence factor TspB C-terminal domain-related protein [Xenophilus aerolatus]
MQTTQSGTTSCSGGTCTTTTTNNTTIINKPGDTSCPSGTTQGTTTKDGQTVTTCSSSSTSTSSQSQTGYCKGSGAGSAQCGGEGSGSSFGGNCAAGFKAVSEDAVLNAMAEEQWRRNCQFFDKVPEDTEESLAYADMKAKGKAGVDQTNDLPAASKREISIGPGDFDSSNALGGAACITDRTIVVMGRSVSLPFSQLCVWLGYMGTVLLACSYLVAARIVMGAK